MRLPVPKNRLVAFTLAGALLTAVVAGGLAFPIPGVTSGDAASESGDSASTGVPQAASDAPTPNPDFTPAVQAQSGGGSEGYEDDAYEDEEHEEHEDEDDEYEAHEDD